MPYNKHTRQIITLIHGWAESTIEGGKNVGRNDIMITRAHPAQTEQWCTCGAARGHAARGNPPYARARSLATVRPEEQGHLRTPLRIAHTHGPGEERRALSDVLRGYGGLKLERAQQLEDGNLHPARQ